MEGQVSVFAPQRRSCYECVFQPPKDDLVITCSEGGIFPSAWSYRFGYGR